MHTEVLIIRACVGYVGGFSNVFPMPSYQADAVTKFLTDTPPPYTAAQFNNSGKVCPFPFPCIFVITERCLTSVIPWCFTRCHRLADTPTYLPTGKPHHARDLPICYLSLTSFLKSQLRDRRRRHSLACLWYFGVCACHGFNHYPHQRCAYCGGEVVCWSVTFRVEQGVTL